MGLHNSDSNWVTSESEVEGVAIDYFNDLFATTSPSGLLRIFKRGTHLDYRGSK